MIVVVVVYLCSNDCAQYEHFLCLSPYNERNFECYNYLKLATNEFEEIIRRQTTILKECIFLKPTFYLLLIFIFKCLTMYSKGKK